MYDLVEFLANCPGTYRLPKGCNDILEREKSGYRFVSTQLTPISNEQELGAIEDALEFPSRFNPVQQHIRTAVDLFSDRKSPEYRNSIKESISAVEAMCKILTGLDDATLGQALKRLEEKGIELHPALRSSFSSL